MLILFKINLLGLWFVFSDTMENWDEKKLEEVVNKKHGEAEKKKAKTQIVSVVSCRLVDMK